MYFVVNFVLFYEISFMDKQYISRYNDNMKNDVRKHLGLKVRAMRESANMTQEELAVICDVSWRTISNLERGTVVPDLFMIYRIAQKFDVRIDELLDHQITNQKSLSRLKKENRIIEKIKQIDDETQTIQKRIFLITEILGYFKVSFFLSSFLCKISKSRSMPIFIKTVLITASSSFPSR